MESFPLFSFSHIATLSLISIAVFLLLYFRQPIAQFRYLRTVEVVVACSLAVFEIGYHLWLIRYDLWDLSNSLPLELCSLTLICSILLLLTQKEYLVPFVFFAGIGGAVQALLTPDLDWTFPHFRYVHFFYVHAGIVLIACYVTWVKNIRPTFKGVLQTMAVLNVLLPIISLINWLVDGNYMFLRAKPSGGSLLDYLGPYPWYILSLELTAFCLFILLWLIGKNRTSS